MRSIRTGNGTQHLFVHLLNHSLTCSLIKSTNTECLGAGGPRMSRALFLPSEFSLSVYR